jgi:hypothetical protein
MSVISLAVTLIVIAVLLWLVNAYLPMDGKIKLKQDMNSLRKWLAPWVALWSIGAPLAAISAIYPLKVGPTQRYLVDQAGTPFLIHADSPWSLIIALNNSEANLYLQDRGQKGFNTLIVELIEHQYHGDSNPNSSPVNRYGQGPFLTPGIFRRRTRRISPTRTG